MVMEVLSKTYEIPILTHVIFSFIIRVQKLNCLVTKLQQTQIGGQKIYRRLSNADMVDWFNDSCYQSPPTILVRYQWYLHVSFLSELGCRNHKNAEVYFFNGKLWVILDQKYCEKSYYRYIIATSKQELNLYRGHMIYLRPNCHLQKNDFLNGAEPPNRLHENIH